MQKVTVETILNSEKVFAIDIEVYRNDIIFVYGGDEKSQKRKVKKLVQKEFRKHVDELYVELQREEVKQYRGMYSSLSPLKIITIKSQDSFWEFQNILVHECLHATFDILRNVGMVLTEESEEAFTYLQQYLYDSINNEMFKTIEE